MLIRIWRILARLVGLAGVDDSLERYYIRVLRHDSAVPTRDQAWDDFERSAAGMIGWEPMLAKVEIRKDAVRPYRR